MPSQLTSTLSAEGEKLLACIHCGLCLEACPTYVATGDENDSPRGRIYLMRAVAEEKLAATSNSFQKHIDRCLGCRACEPVCPAGVEYGQLLEGARAEIFAEPRRLTIAQRALRFALSHVWPHPTRLRFLFSFARLARDTGLARPLLKSGLPRLLSKRAEFGLALLASSKGTGPRITANGVRANHSEQAQAVMLFQGCVTEGLFARINRATARVLQVNHCRPTTPAAQTCCGALHAHAGDLDGARRLALKNIAAFENDEAAPIVTNAGGCGAMLISYAHLFATDEAVAERARTFSQRVRDISQQLGHTGVRQGAAVGTAAVTYDASCHLINGQHAGDAPFSMLRAIPELNLVALAGSDRCCGGAGVYNLMEPDLSGRVLAEKLQCVREAGASILATGNPGCHMQIGAGAMLAGDSLRLCHPVELLDESYRRAGYYDESEGSRH